VGKGFFSGFKKCIFKVGDLAEVKHANKIQL